MDLTNLRRQKQAIEELARQYGVRNIRVFGSVARGESRADSDLDLLVDADRGLGLRLFAFQEELSALVGRPVDVVIDGPVPVWANRMMDRVRLEAVTL